MISGDTRYPIAPTAKNPTGWEEEEKEAGEVGEVGRSGS